MIDRSCHKYSILFFFLDAVLFLEGLLPTHSFPGQAIHSHPLFVSLSTWPPRSRFTRLESSSTLEETPLRAQITVRATPCNQRQKIKIAVQEDHVISTQYQGATTDMIPLSLNPPLLVSRYPVLTAHECQTLIECCQEADQRGISVADIMHGSEDSCGKHVLKRLQKLVHHSVLGLRGTEQDYIIPRYLHYPACDIGNDDNDKSILEKVTVDRLFPDGLHVDTNNNQHFRHWTILVYLDSLPDEETGGATTFPLAERLTQCPPSVKPGSWWHTPTTAAGMAYHNDDDDDNEAQHDRIGQAARELLWKQNRHHTKLTEAQLKSQISNNGTGLLLEQAALDLWREDVVGTDTSRTTPHCSTRGIRVRPCQGHVCVFSSQQADGFPNPYSFHAGEALLCRTTTNSRKGKHILTFFNEIPNGYFQDRDSFGEQVRTRHEAFWSFHGWSCLQDVCESVDAKLNV